MMVAQNSPYIGPNAPNSVDSWAKPNMTEDELDVIGQIDLLPRKTFARKLIDLLGSDTLRARVFGKVIFPYSLLRSVYINFSKFIFIL